MSFINDIAFDERLAVLEIEGTLTVGGDILLQGEFPKMDQKLAALNSSIALKANQSDMDELEVTLNTKANRSDLDIALSLTGEQADALNVLLGTKANQSDVDAELALKANQTDMAQEVMEVLPEAVLEVYNGTAEETLYTLAYGNLAGLFVEAIKELKGELDALKKKVGV